MKLTLQDVTQKKNEFEKAGITLPSYDIEAVHKKTLEEPVCCLLYTSRCV